MSVQVKVYCLDANVLIQAWQKYYSPKFCPGYWDVLNGLGSQGRISLAEEVFNEITRTEDDLCEWLKASKITVKSIDEKVTKCLQDIYAKDPIHKTLVDNTKARSLADPWVIAHAISDGAIVVTKEEKVTALNSNRIKIPNVCDTMGVTWINDFEFISALNIQFTCTIP